MCVESHGKVMEKIKKVIVVGQSRKVMEHIAKKETQGNYLMDTSWNNNHKQSWKSHGTVMGLVFTHPF
jgi:hypothetical protein